MGKINTDNYPNRPFSSYQDDDMFILQDNGGETYTTNVGDVKNLADSRIKLEGVKVNGTDLPITDKKVNVDISGKTDLSVIAYTFNSEMGYFKGAYVTYNGKLYEFIQEHTGAWNPSHVREIRASGQYVRTGNGGYNNGDRATCEGYMTKASGNYSHAEGRETQAVGDCTHAEGRETIANGIYQHVEGKYNIADNENKYIHIIGNGIDDNNRSNAMTLDWDGNLEVSGDVEDGNGEKISDKTDKVTNATSGNLAGLDSNGNLTDSGVSPTEEVTVEGNPVTFVSPFEQDAKSVVVSVKPIQDLHGLPFPYVGGAYKNKLPLTIAKLKAINTEGTWNGNVYTFDGITYDVKTDNGGNVTEILINGAVTVGKSRSDMYLLKAEAVDAFNNMYLNGTPSGGSVNTYYTVITMDSEPYTNYRDDGSGKRIGAFDSGTIGSAYITIRNGVTATNMSFKPMISDNGGDFAPYSNECPISGIDELEIGVSGKNLVSAIEQGGFGNDGADSSATNRLRNDGYISVIGGSKYTVSNSASLQTVVFFWDEQGVATPYQSSGWQNSPYTFEVPANAKYVRIMLRKSDNSDLTPSDSQKIQMECGENATAYADYVSPTTTTIPLPSTLYGGEVDVTEGSADENFACSVITADDINNVNVEGTGFFRVFLKSSKYALSQLYASAIANSYSVVRSYNDVASTDGCIALNSAEGTVFLLHNNQYSTGTDVINGITNQPIQICYPLATPETITLTPAILELLKGTNVVTTNGEKVAVTYGRSLWQDIDKLKTDTEGKLDKSNVADVEGDTASRPYAVNEFMLRSDGFYKVTQPIAQNASITASNTTKTTVGEVLTALLNA